MSVVLFIWLISLLGDDTAPSGAVSLPKQVVRADCFLTFYFVLFASLLLEAFECHDRSSSGYRQSSFEGCRGAYRSNGGI